MTDRELMQQALDDLVDIKVEDGIDCVATILALRARLATCDRCGKVNPAELHTCTPPEPVAWTPVEIGVDVTSAGTHVVGMYVLMPDVVRHVFYSQFHPAPQREWVGLTDEEMMQIYVALKSVAGFYSIEKYARAIEVNLKEKNNG